MDLENVIRRLQELLAMHGNVKVDVVTEAPNIQVEEECGDFVYSPREHRVKILGKSV